MFGLVKALNRLAAAIEKDGGGSPEHLAVLEQVAAQNQRALQMRAEWEETERRHMAECSRQYHRMREREQESIQ